MTTAVAIGSRNGLVRLNDEVVRLLLARKESTDQVNLLRRAHDNPSAGQIREFVDTNTPVSRLDGCALESFQAGLQGEHKEPRNVFSKEPEVQEHLLKRALGRPENGPVCGFVHGHSRGLTLALISHGLALLPHGSLKRRVGGFDDVTFASIPPAGIAIPSR